MNDKSEFLKTENGEQMFISSDKLAINPEGSCVTWREVQITKADAIKVVKALILCHDIDFGLEEKL